jgi:TRAP-type mannitol/chloroaromatic compound transport system substrate-binding protein
MKNVKKLAAILFMLVFVVPAVAAKDKTYKWRIAESWPKDFPIYGQGVKDFIQLVNNMSGGRIIVESHTSEVHKKPLNVLEMVRDGEYHMGHTASYYAKGLDINTLFFTSVPFGMITSEKESWFYHGGGLEYMKKVYSKYGIYAYPGGNSSNQMGGWFKKEIKTIEDLQGLRMRLPGLGGDLMKKLGVEVINLPPSELYKALESNKLDAVEWVGPSMDIGMGFHKLASYYYTGWHEPGSALMFYVNQKEFNTLPDDLQNILTAAMRVISADMYSKVIYESAINLNKILEENPEIKIRALPKKVTRFLSDETVGQIDQLVKDDQLAQEILTSMRDYKKKVRVWTRISDQAFLNNGG